MINSKLSGCFLLISAQRFFFFKHLTIKEYYCELTNKHKMIICI